MYVKLIDKKTQEVYYCKLIKEEERSFYQVEWNNDIYFFAIKCHDKIEISEEEYKRYLDQ